MALGDPVNANTDTGNSSTPQSMTARWNTVIDAGGLDDADAATITDPDAEITTSNRHILNRQGKGTLLLLRAVYDDGVSGVTSPVVQVFGRADDSEPWTCLANKAGDFKVTITFDTTNDASNGTLNFTNPDWTNHVWDCQGCEQLLVGVATAASGTGTFTTAYLEAKVI